MGEEKSQFLHGLRWLAALIVVMGHAQMIGGGGDPVLAFIGSFDHAAVMVFFVLSGYVIAATVDRKRESGYSLRDYFLDRGSRIYSVLLPAIVLTIVLDFVGAQFFPVRYADPSLVPQSQWLIRLLINLVCLQGIWGFRVQFGTDAALWSIGYEFCYYVLFALYTWRPKYWLVLSAAVLIVVGPWVAAYGLVWVLGVVAYRSGRRTNILWALPIFLLAAYVFEHLALPAPELLRDLAFAVAVVALVLSTARLPNALFPINRELANFSYSTYAYHMPVMFLAFCIVPATPIWTWAVVAASITIARALYHVTEKQRGLLRRMGNVLLPRWSRSPLASET